MEAQILALAVAAFACLTAFYTARLAAAEHPLTWGAVFASGGVIAGLWMFLDVAGPAGRAGFLAASAYVLAVIIGANRGMVQLEAQLKAEAERLAERRAHIATLGLCVSCGSGDPVRSQCPWCNAVYCEGCYSMHCGWHMRNGACLSPTDTHHLTTGAVRMSG